MVLAVNRAVAAGARAVVCASTGNTSASAAAYAAAAGLPCHVILPAGKVARGKMAQALAAGAKLIMVDGNFDAALAAVRRLGEDGLAVVVNSINPDRLTGQQTAAFEVVDALGEAPDALALPVGNAGNITAYWRGFRAYADAGRTPGAKLPRMLGFQAEGAAPIVRGEPVESPETVATAIRIGNPASWQQAVAARDESGGLIESVTDDEILDAQRMVAAARRGLLRAGLRRGRGRRAASRRGAAHRRGRDGRLRAHRPRPEGSGRRSGRGGHVDADPVGSRQHPARDGHLRPAPKVEAAPSGGAAGVDDGGRELLRRCALAHVGGLAGLERHMTLGVAPPGGDDPHGRPGTSQSGDEGETGLDVGQPRVHQDHVGQLLLHQLERRAHVASATHDLHLAGDAQQVSQALLDAAICVDDHHPRRSGQGGARAG